MVRCSPARGRGLSPDDAVQELGDCPGSSAGARGISSSFSPPRITPDFIKAQRLLAACPGVTGIWFAGSYTGEVDSQETALLSAMNVVRQLDPQAPNLLALESYGREA